MTRGDLRRLAALLGQERAALARGDLARLEHLAPRKVALLDRIEGAALPDTPVDRALAQQIHQAAQHNARLFQAAIGGIRDARALLARARETGRGQTYGRNGARASLDPPGGSLHRRA
ncbi:MAG: hypothetical protein ACK4GT_09105 [Pararhodobacter sp.]